MPAANKVRRERKLPIQQLSILGMYDLDSNLWDTIDRFQQYAASPNPLRPHPFSHISLK